MEIQGFKSFPDKTVLNFGEDITAIVGPNGSGKSNISDAIRWVMGEQSSKSLRGVKMEDVIFGGTETRNQMGFAQVTLVLDNTEHIFPSMEETEVAVTRRYYRSGESEYYINKQSVRLRDVNELFMDNEHWKKLITLLSEYHFLILAGPGDTFCEEIRTEAPERVENLAGKTTLLESCYLIHRSHIVVSADTGFMHAADLFRIPTLALIGPTAFGFPTGPTAEIFETALSCRPCTKDGSGKCKKGVYQQCMVDIRPETIATRIRQLLPIK